MDALLRDAQHTAHTLCSLDFIPRPGCKSLGGPDGRIYRLTENGLKQVGGRRLRTPAPKIEELFWDTRDELTEQAVFLWLQDYVAASLGGFGSISYAFASTAKRTLHQVIVDKVSFSYYKPRKIVGECQHSSLSKACIDVALKVKAEKEYMEAVLHGGDS